MSILSGKAGLLLTIIAAGYLLKRTHVLKTEDAKVLSRIMIYLTLPAALISGFRNFPFQTGLLLLAALALACNLILLGLGLLLTRGKPLEERALYGLQLSSYNIGAFVLPFVQNFMPAEGLVGASLFDAGNCPMNCGISYALVLSAASGKRISLRFVGRHLLQSPPFMTYMIMLLAQFLRIRLPDILFRLAEGISPANTILAMLMIGVLLEPAIPKTYRTQVFQILTIRYFCNAVFACVIWFLPLSLLLKQIAILSVMAPIPSMALIYSKKCGCDDAVCGLLSSLSLIISLPIVFALLLAWNL